MKTTAEIRSLFLEFFKSEEHHIMSSGPLVVPNDPTLMFTNAGMVTFKDFFTGEKKITHKRVATSQKCIRISGKHNDLANVGRTSRHHTFFEMLGNFSFGDYFKEKACSLAWQFLTQELRLDTDKLWVSVFAGDDEVPFDNETFDIWKNQIGVPPEKILKLTSKDNFWSMGDTGPCGPCSEILYDRGEKFGEAAPSNQERFFELWNLVFMQFTVNEKGARPEKLPSPCIDTGAGLERIASVIQNVDSNYDIDLFKPLIELVNQISGTSYGLDEKKDISIRVITDHARMAAFLISEGIFPEKTGREYVLRRVMRRAIRHGHRLGIDDFFFYKVTGLVVDIMHPAYPELGNHRELIEKICRQEEELFRATLQKGLLLLEKNFSGMGEGGDISGSGGILSGELAFDLSSTYGFPLDLIEVIAEENNFKVNLDEYEKVSAQHKIISGAGKIGEKAVSKIYKNLRKSLGEIVFSGYETTSDKAQVLAVVKDERAVEKVKKGDFAGVIVSRTPFFGESGGQVGDTGIIKSENALFLVKDTICPLSGLTVHMGTVEKGCVRPGDRVDMIVDSNNRKSICQHHSATHLLHFALRQIVGNHATQKGSRVDADNLRFDFSSNKSLKENEINEIEARVNEEILTNKPVTTRIMKYKDAVSAGAMAIFEETYKDDVRMVNVGEKSLELCGGTHVTQAGQIGAFFITSSSSISSGVMRITAVAGKAAVKWASTNRKILKRVGIFLQTSPDKIPETIEALSEKNKILTNKLAKIERESIIQKTKSIDAHDVDGIKVIGTVLKTGSPSILRDTVDTMRQHLGSGIVCVGGPNNGKASIIVALTKDLTDKYDARELINKVALHVNGKGGGKPEIAQAGGPLLDNLDEAVKSIYTVVSETTNKTE